ncbi:hypothetical protein SO802_017575 [Lithocarpus litseifolius]|uniref:Uncharacterized protein n=1 Tax=Lithocarpus litseifolius TaxID=425828 RepID=A0AAW2CK92_9ROSI
MNLESLSSMVEQQVKTMIGYKTNEANVHMVDNALERLRELLLLPQLLDLISNSVIQQLNKSPAQISNLALLLSFDVHCNALLKEACVPTSATESSFEGMVSTMLATNQISFTDDELPLEGHQIRNNTGIIRGGIKSSLSHLLVPGRILSEYHHIPGDDLTSTIRPCVPGEKVGH